MARMPVTALGNMFVRSRRRIAGIALSCVLTLGCSTVPERRRDSADGGQSTGGSAGENDGLGGNDRFGKNGGPGGNDGLGWHGAHDAAGILAGGAAFGC